MRRTIHVYADILSFIVPAGSRLRIQEISTCPMIWSIEEDPLPSYLLNVMSIYTSVGYLLTSECFETNWLSLLAQSYSLRVITRVNWSLSESCTNTVQGRTNDAQICRKMMCFQQQFCYASYEQRAFTGTTCGNRKVRVGSSCCLAHIATLTADCSLRRIVNSYLHLDLHSTFIVYFSHNYKFIHHSKYVNIILVTI